MRRFDPHDRTPAEELDELLDAVSYELSSARSAGIGRLQELRSALKRARDLVTEADALASSEAARLREAEDQ